MIAWTILAGQNIDGAFLQTPLNFFHQTFLMSTSPACFNARKAAPVEGKHEYRWKKARRRPRQPQSMISGS
jgi:hypothetical protein